jgi:hypothetical protein
LQACCIFAVLVQDFGIPRSSSHAAFSGVASPHSGMATPTAAGAPAGLFSPGPGGFFGGGSLAMRHGSMQALGEALSLGMRSGEADAAACTTLLAACCSCPRICCCSVAACAPCSTCRVHLSASNCYFERLSADMRALTGRHEQLAAALVQSHVLACSGIQANWGADPAPWLVALA